MITKEFISVLEKKCWLCSAEFGTMMLLISNTEKLSMEEEEENNRKKIIQMTGKNEKIKIVVKRYYLTFM